MKSSVKISPPIWLFLFLFLSIFNYCKTPASITGINTEVEETTKPTETSVTEIKIEPPTFSPKVGHYNTAQEIRIHSVTSGSTIHYTLDGIDPTPSSPVFKDPFHIYSIAGKTLKAVAIKDSKISSVSSAVYSYPPLKTLQIKCSSALGFPLDCPGTGQDGETRSGVDRKYIGPTQHHIFSSDYITTDRSTGYIWKTCTQGQSGADCSVGKEIGMNWQDSQTGPNGCDSLNRMNGGVGYAGIKTWRLPTSHELETLIHFGKSRPTIDEVAFPRTNGDLAVGNFYWSSTSHSKSNLHAWFVCYCSGSVLFTKKNVNSAYARCIAG